MFAVHRLRDNFIICVQKRDDETAVISTFGTGDATDFPDVHPVPRMNLQSQHSVFRVCLLSVVDSRSPDVCAGAPHPLAGGTVAGWLGCRASVGEASRDVMARLRRGCVMASHGLRAPMAEYCSHMKLGPGLTFSWKRALGVTSAKRKLSRATGIPTTRSGRRAKLGRIFGMK